MASDPVLDPLERIGAALRGVRYNGLTELALQDAIAERFVLYGIPHAREQELSARDRPDFLVATDDRATIETVGDLTWEITQPCIAIEVKVKGTPAALRSQVTRYLEHDVVLAAVLVSTREVLLRSVDPITMGKPVRRILVRAWP